MLKWIPSIPYLVKLDFIQAWWFYKYEMMPKDFTKMKLKWKSKQNIYIKVHEKDKWATSNLTRLNTSHISSQKHHQLEAVKIYYAWQKDAIKIKSKIKKGFSIISISKNCHLKNLITTPLLSTIPITKKKSLMSEAWSGTKVLKTASFKILWSPTTGKIKSNT